MLCLLAMLTTLWPAPAASWIAVAPTLLEPPQTRTDLPLEDGFDALVGIGRARVSFLKRHVAAVEMARGSTAAEL
jgi:hypothetical protein